MVDSLLAARRVPAALCLILLSGCAEQAAESVPLSPLPTSAAPQAAVGRVAPVEAAPAPRPEARAAAVLAAWDQARAAAYVAGDGRALRTLYADGAGTEDVRLLRAYARRGVQVTALRMQVWKVRVVRARDDSLRLVVLDRVLVRLTRSGQALSTPADRPSRHAMTLVRRHGRWRVASVSAVRP